LTRGIDKFREFFRDFREQYVLIGGVACELVFGEADMSFRATKDFDMVLIVEALTPEFGTRFWSFISEGAYDNRVKSDGKPQYYRFEKPKSTEYPFMIELFAKSDYILNDDKSICRPIQLGEGISSLSAILLNDDYYQILLSGRTIISDIPVLPDTHLILFKAKAWLDLTERKASSQSIKTKDINKHKNDVARIAYLLTGNERCEVPASIYDDMTQFIESFEKDPPDIKSLRLAGVTESEIIALLKKIYVPLGFQYRE
jgi:hypothetical protein